ncbi:MAG: NADH-quinone oxidoreductase subunit NuoK [Gemmatimonadetes bacterium]|nr:NADH-quinone oxidoreductase subunit NuoK [Gemmatimonadota bacterium]
MNEAGGLAALGLHGQIAVFTSAVLFVIGAIGVLMRRNVIMVFMCIELMLTAGNVALVAFSRAHGIEGHIMVFFVMAVAAAEAAVGLAIIVAIFRHYGVVDLDRFRLLRW